MKFAYLYSQRILLMVTVLILSFLDGCAPVTEQMPGLQGNRGPSGVVEMDQNTDPRFFLPQRRGTIGRLEAAGEHVRLNGVRVNRDVQIKNGDHVATGRASWARIVFSPVRNRACRIETRNLRDGRIFGIVHRCGHFVTAYQAAMETLQDTASYHVEIMPGNEVAFRAIDGPLKVWLQFDPSSAVVVPGRHQVIVSDARIGPIRNVEGQIGRITGWRDNFRRFREQSVQVPDLRKRSAGEAARWLKRLGLRIDVTPPNANLDYRIIRQTPDPGSRVDPGSTVEVTVDVPGGRTFDLPVREIFKRPDVMTTPTQVTQWVTVPDLRSPRPRSLAESGTILKRLGLDLRYTPRNARGEYWVVRQSPAAGSRVKKGTIVNLTLNAPIQ